MISDLVLSEIIRTCPTPEPEPDFCAGDPCQNGGTCYNTTGTYHCDCDINWTGNNCTDGKEVRDLRCEILN